MLQVTKGGTVHLMRNTAMIIYLMHFTCRSVKETKATNTLRFLFTKSFTINRILLHNVGKGDVKREI